MPPDTPRRPADAPIYLEVRCDRTDRGAGAGPDRALPDDWRRRIRAVRLIMPAAMNLPSHTNVLPTEAAEIVGSLPSLRTLTLLVGDPAEARDDELRALEADCDRRGVRFALGYVLEGLSKTSLVRVLESSRALRSRGVPVQWWIPLLPESVFRLEILFSTARDAGIEPILVPSAILAPAVAARGLAADERLFAWDFVTYRLLEEDRQLLTPAKIDYYRSLQTVLKGDSTTEVEGPTVAVQLVGDGAWGEPRLAPPQLPWPEDEDPSAGTASGPIHAALAHAADIGSVLFDGSRGLFWWMMAQTSARSSGAGVEQLPHALLIGAYGGEHIGDIAILGGVLLRIHERYGTTRATLMSQRPDHTRRLVPMLDVPVTIEVRPYEHPAIRDCLQRVDGVVYAGGPLTDLPKQLVRHLYAASIARRSGKPFVIEGIGAGPFVRWPSEWVGRRILNMAHRLAVRTSADAQHRVMRDLTPEVGRDPAFDYLESRPRTLTRLPEVDRAWIDRLLDGVEGRAVIGINLRPIRHLYTPRAPGRDLVDFTREIESRFEQRFAEALRRFDRAISPKPCFVFYPMNAIQFGQSDLRSAYRVRKHLGDDVDFRIWEGDASLDGVVALLRRVDLVIAMRFHAAIFALSQKRTVIGIDYRIGKRDKVASLLSDCDQAENCSRIDELTADWLLDRLRAHCPLSKCGEGIA